MDTFKQAVLYIARYKKLTLLKLLALLLLFASTFTYLNVVSAVQQTKKTAKQHVGVTYMLNNREIEKGIDLKTANKIASYPQVKHHNYYVMAKAKATNITAQSEPGQYAGEKRLLSSNQKASGLLKVEGVSFSEYMPSFTDQHHSLVKGRHLTEKDSNQEVVLIERRLAEANNLTLGSKLEIESATSNDRALSLKVVGIYTTSFFRPAKIGLDGSDGNLSNKIIIPYSYAAYLNNGHENDKISQAIYTLKDEKEVNEFLKTAEKDLNNSSLTLSKENTRYKQLTKDVAYVEKQANKQLKGLILLGGALYVCIGLYERSVLLRRMKKTVNIRKRLAVATIITWTAFMLPFFITPFLSNQFTQYYMSINKPSLKEPLTFQQAAQENNKMALVDSAAIEPIDDLYIRQKASTVICGSTIVFLFVLGTTVLLVPYRSKQKILY
ncbi:ABC transporter permease [Bacillus testis]|uniref:ABC transporter permease n=1 Tax=Bacillus testis TaxID=1622072 RepID=UPI00067F45FC|nr:ABC transporter permease [Bacillus testis]